MKYRRLKMDWALLIRIIFGLVFIAIAVKFNDWMPAFFGGFIILIGIIGSITRSGCGYTDNCT